MLPPEVAAKIAAGEVVERPASVVKELVENSIDAGARRIRIEVRDGGRRLIRVSDDGCGIPAEEVPLAFTRHATSKLTSIEDLQRITTLGFRGEALASIAAVSHLTLVSCPAAGAGMPSLTGTQVQLEGGRQIWLGPYGAPLGTTVTIEHLFYNVPARLKFLKAPATEAGYIHRVVVAYALAYPEISFQLTLDRREALYSSGNGRLGDVLVEVLGLDSARQMVALDEEYAGVDSPGSGAGIRISGYVGLPTLHRAQRDQLILFVNRRWVQERSLAVAIAQAYQSLLPIGRHPVAVINIGLDPSEVDVNVHPTKSEVKFRDQPAVFSTLQRAVRRCVIDAAQPPQIGPIGRTGSRRLVVNVNSAGHGADQVSGWQRSSQLGFEAQRTLADEASLSASQRIPVLRVVGQLAQTYILAEGPDGLYLVDQHAAHERVLYEQLRAAQNDRAGVAQHLLKPVTLELSPGQAAVLDAHAEALSQLGIEIEHFGGYTYRLLSLPTILQNEEPAAAIGDILAELAEDATPMARRSEQRLLITVCKRAAIKAGRVLSMSEMQELIRSLEQCEAPRTCPHGRPTMVHLSTAQLAREFGRL